MKDTIAIQNKVHITKRCTRFYEEHFEILLENIKKSQINGGRSHEQIGRSNIAKKSILPSFINGSQAKLCKSFS